MSPSNSIASRIEEMSIPEPNTGCWLWLGAAYNDKGDYRPTMRVGGKNKKVHRVSLETFKGPIPTGLFACHTCHNTLCVNPDHLYAGTALQNAADMMRAGRHFTQNGSGDLQKFKDRTAAYQKARRENPFCNKGIHRLEGANLLIRKASGKRQCRDCYNAAHRAWKAKTKCRPKFEVVEAAS